MEILKRELLISKKELEILKIEKNILKYKLNENIIQKWIKEDLVECDEVKEFIRNAKEDLKEQLKEYEDRKL